MRGWQWKSLARKKKKLFLNKRRNRCHWLIDFNSCVQLWNNPIGDCINGALHNLFLPAHSCGRTVKESSFIRMVSITTSKALSAWWSWKHQLFHQWTVSISMENRNMLHLAASSPTGRTFFFPLTLVTVGSLVAAVAHTVTRHTQSVPTTLRINTLGGRNVTLCALPATIALTAPPGILAITAAQDRTSSWGKTTGLKNLQTVKCRNITKHHIDFKKPIKAP